MVREPEEQILTGGNTNSVVRIGDTVHRQMTPHHKTIHAFLRHLEDKRFPAPRPKGIDQSGREVLSFVEGDTDWSETHWDNVDALVAAAKLLRSLHDASLDFSPTEPESWAFRYPDASKREVICHNDFAPYNLVFRAGVPIAVIDFDLCGPGPRNRDLAYLAYWMTPLSFLASDLCEATEKDLASGSSRFKLLCETYGGQSLEGVLHMVSEVLHHMGDEAAVRKMVGAHVAGRLRDDGHLDHWAQEAQAFDRNLGRLKANISW